MCGLWLLRVVQMLSLRLLPFFRVHFVFLVPQRIILDPNAVCLYAIVGVLGDSLSSCTRAALFHSNSPRICVHSPGCIPLAKFAHFMDQIWMLLE